MTEAMTAGTASTRHSADTRQRLMEAGARAFSTAGFHGAKVSRIAADAGVANGTFYLHFADKRELFGALAEEAALELARDLATARSEHKADPEAAQRAQIEVLVTFAEEHPHLLRTALSAPPDGGMRWLGLFGMFADRLEADLRAGRRAGHIRHDIDLEVAAHAGIGMFLHVLVWWGDDGYRIPRREVVDTLVRLHRGATSPRPGTAKRRGDA